LKIQFNFKDLTPSEAQDYLLKNVSLLHIPPQEFCNLFNLQELKAACSKSSVPQQHTKFTKASAISTKLEQKNEQQQQGNKHDKLRLCLQAMQAEQNETTNSSSDQIRFQHLVMNALLYETENCLVLNKLKRDDKVFSQQSNHDESQLNSEDTDHLFKIDRYVINSYTFLLYL